MYAFPFCLTNVFLNFNQKGGIVVVFWGCEKYTIARCENLSYYSYFCRVG